MTDNTSRLSAFIERNWYDQVWRNAWLLPLWPIVFIVVVLRRLIFRLQPPPANKTAVVVVGNLTVGGTGKTPLITWLVHRSRELGFTPAVVSRGYGGHSNSYPLSVVADTPVTECGDEPRLLQSRLHCPVIVDPLRRRGVAAMPENVDIVFSDDGLQHYGLRRDIELVVVDGQRGFGNGWLLPIGPLREPLSRLRSVDLVLRNGQDFTVQPQALINALSGERWPLDKLQGQVVSAVAGIGNPQRFYATLTALGMQVEAHSFADHHTFRRSDFDFLQGSLQPLVMTEKDWVKCRVFAQPNWWYLQVEAVPEPDIRVRLDQLLLALRQNADMQKDGIPHG